jgi:hypothetical protein
MIKIKILAIGLLLVLMGSNIRSQSVNFEVIGFTNDGSKYEDIEIISNDNDYSRKWKREVDTSSTISPIDFDKERIIVISRGQCSSGGYSIGVDRVYLKQHDLTIEFTYSNPGENCRRTMGLTYPTIMIRIKNNDLPLVFLKSTVLRDCK